MKIAKSHGPAERPARQPAFVCLLLMLLSAALASGAKAQTPDDVLSVRRTALSVDYARQGSEFRAAVVLEIKYDIGDRREVIAPYHVNSALPHEPGLIPTRLEMEEAKGFTLSPVKYPKGRDASLKFSNCPLSVYSAVPGEPVVLMLDVRVAPDVPLNLYYLRGKLTYQVCGDEGCEAGRTADVLFTVTVVDAKTRVRRINKHHFGPTARDYLLAPVRAVTLTGRCLVKGCS